MNAETQAVLFNAVPLLVLAALYLTVGVALAPALWRERGGRREIGFAVALVFPCIGLAAAVVGIVTLVTREALAGHVAGLARRHRAGGRAGGRVLRNWDDRRCS